MVFTVVCITHLLQPSLQKPKRFFHKCRTCRSGHTVIFGIKALMILILACEQALFFGGNPREKIHENRSLASRNGELDHRAKLILDLT